ncbi:hypothetical protein JCM3765_000673 [Sporobolomyces pararoseus]
MTQITRTSEEAEGEGSYVLSAILKGHTNDVRSLSSAGSSTSSSSTIYSGSRDGTARSWYYNKKDNEWIQGQIWKPEHPDDEGYINSVCYFNRQDQGYLLTAGADSLIKLYKTSTSTTSSSSSEPIQILFGHSHNVCSLHVNKKSNKLLSASWDMTVRIWYFETSTQQWECRMVLKDHGAAVWDVLLLENENEHDNDDDHHQSTLCLTACADNYVRLFKDDKVERIFKGHTGPVRALSRIDDEQDSSLFASASNDGTIRIWNFKTGQPLTILNHKDFIYSITSIGGEGLASSGEDGLIKIWNGQTGKLDQILELPCLSVWKVLTLEEEEDNGGDLVCAGSDHLIWIFTKDLNKVAKENDLKEYESKLLEKKRNSSKNSPSRSEERGGVAVHSDLKELDKPGQSKGELKLVKEGKEQGSTTTIDIIVAYQWNGSSWENLGQVVDPPSPTTTTCGEKEESEGRREKMVHEGKEFDFVFQIDVSDDKPPLPLPFNLQDDVLEVSKNFVKENELPDSYIDRIVEFIRFNAYS